MNHLYKAV